MSENLHRRLARIEALHAPPRDVQIVHTSDTSEAEAVAAHFGAPEIPRGVRVTFVEIMRFSEGTPT